ncbi:MAG: glycerol-3-phosphate 1-O-acyltransferase PlsY [Clostridiales bacterium]|nr:glycerol-3-phosphate 1-O-acyltransferase PlsY [Clostridiales bacterium]
MSSTEITRLVIIGLVAYLMGNINPAIILGKIKGIDIRKEGSGNAGMTNAIRVMGLGAGITVFIVDVLKAFFAVRIGYNFGGDTGAMVAFGAVVLGHCFPAVWGFKGGKGVAAAFGAAFALNWLSAIAALVIAGVIFAITRRMSIASIVAALAYPALIWFYEPDYFYFSIGAAAFLVIMHLANIKRLAKGEEKPLTIGGKENVEEKEYAEAKPALDASLQGKPLSAEEKAGLNASDQEFEDLSLGESPVAADATKEPALVAAQASEASRPEPEPMDYYEGTVIPELGDKARKIAVIGSGSFGTAMANLLVYNGHDVTLYGRNKAALDAMKETRMNERYLPYVILSDRIRYTNNIRNAVRGKDMVVFAVPAQKFRQVSAKAAQYLEDGVIVINLAKGIEKKTLLRMSEVAAETIPGVRYVALSGPTHAEEIVRNTPAGIVAASADEEAARIVQDTFMSGQLRVYTQKDVTGVEIAGAVKNVIAIATGISDGMKLGNNARAALMTRSIHEIKRLGDAMGAQPETFAGLSGIGDLIVTCSTNLSRNRRCGLLIGLGLSAKDAVERVGSVVEGYYTADAVCDLAKKLDVDMPVCKATQAVLKGRILPEKAVSMLMSRDKKDELK